MGLEKWPEDFIQHIQGLYLHQLEGYHAFSFSNFLDVVEDCPASDHLVLDNLNPAHKLHGSVSTGWTFCPWGRYHPCMYDLW